MATINPQQNRKILKSVVASHYGTVRAAEEIVTEEIKKATAAIKALVDAEGPGPHKFKDGAGTFWLTFRKGKGDSHYSIKRKDDSGDDEAVPLPDGTTQPS